MKKIFLDSKDAFLKSILERDLKEEGIEITPFTIEKSAEVEIVIVDIRNKKDLESVRMIRERNGRAIIFGLIPYKDETLKHEIFDAGADDVLEMPLEEEKTRILFSSLFAAYKLGNPYSKGRVTDFLSKIKKMIELYHQSEALGVTLLEKLQQIASLRDNDTSEHTQRVGKICELLAEEIGLPPQKVIEIRMTAPLHDIGKIGIPDAVLFKNGPLNDEEWEIMKNHTKIGAKILESDLDILKCARNIALYHHEKYDGTGYPFGIKGEEIPIEARITTVADSFDAIVSQRPYKPPRSFMEGLKELKKNAGTQFDPNVVQAFTHISEKIFSLYKRLQN